jgi:hypothetical protein
VCFTSDEPFLVHSCLVIHRFAPIKVFVKPSQNYYFFLQIEHIITYISDMWCLWYSISSPSPLRLCICLIFHWIIFDLLHLSWSSPSRLPTYLTSNHKKTASDKLARIVGFCYAFWRCPIWRVPGMLIIVTEFFPFFCVWGEGGFSLWEKFQVRACRIMTVSFHVHYESLFTII